MLRITTFTFLLLALAFGQAYKTVTKTSPDGKYTYQEVVGDPLKTRVYTLSNGLTVYLSVNTAEPRIYTSIATRAGSKNDPSDCTGLAHYLEHIVFKGTDKFGTLDYAKEKVELDKIESLFEVYRKTTDTIQRKKLYHEIDSISQVASTYAIANEYDKMLSVIGAKGTNAYTSFEQTVYINDIPANMLEKWLMVESERFRNPVVRIFHTELEAVYEEKNRTLDSDQRQSSELLLSNVFKKHPYGQQTTIGTIEHLKNPSITEIKKYFNKNYVMSNMAVCLAGDLDPDKTIALIDKYFGGFPKVSPPTFTPPVEDPIQGPVVKEVTGKEAEFVSLAFRFPGANTHDALVLEMIDNLLSNGTSGLIDINLNQQQKVLNAGCGVYSMHDYSMHYFNGSNRQGQTLEEVASLLLGQIEELKKGNFDATLLQGIVTDLEKRQLSGNESNQSRSASFVENFIMRRPWMDDVSHLDSLKKITKDDIVAFVNKHYGNNYVVVYKRNGNPVRQKVNKPIITPVQLNRTAKSDFLKMIETAPIQPIAPVYLDPSTAITQTTSSQVVIQTVKNTENERFTMQLVWNTGTMADKRWSVASRYLNYLGTPTLSAAARNVKLYTLGGEMYLNVGRTEISLTISGLDRNFTSTMQIVEDLMRNCQPNPDALANLVQDIQKNRENAKLNKGAIMQGLVNYVKYGPKNPFNDVLSTETLKSIKPEELISLVQSLLKMSHTVMYYGPQSGKTVSAILKKVKHPVSGLTPMPVLKELPTLPVSQNQIYWVDFKMVQAEVTFLSSDVPFDPGMGPLVRMFNEYFGGGMSGIVFQTLRESKALAYAVNSTFSTPGQPGDLYYNQSYIGTQADKLMDAIAGMDSLLRFMPVIQNRLELSKESIQNTLSSERINRFGILSTARYWKKMGITVDPRKKVMDLAPQFTMEQITTFHRDHIASKQRTLVIVGDRNKLNLNGLQKIAPVKELSLQEIFGY